MWHTLRAREPNKQVASTATPLFAAHGVKGVAHGIARKREKDLRFGDHRAAATLTTDEQLLWLLAVGKIFTK